MTKSSNKVVSCYFSYDLELNSHLNYQNELLHKKLVEIAQGKKSSINGPNNKHKRSDSYNPKSLNIAVRRKELERIEKDNMAIAKKLFENSSHFKKKDFDRFYAESCQHRDRIQRIKSKPLPTLKLKPLTISDFKSHPNTVVK